MSIPTCPARFAQDSNIQALWPVAAQSGSPLLPRLIAWAENDAGSVDEIAAIYSEAREAIGSAIADHDADPEYASASGHEWLPDDDAAHADITITAAALAAVAAAAWSAAACAAAEAAATAERARRAAICEHPAYVAAQAIHADRGRLPSRIVWRGEPLATIAYLDARDFVRLDLVRHVECVLDPSAPDGHGVYRDPSRAWITQHVAALRALPHSADPISGSEPEYAATVAAAAEIADRLEAMVALLPPVSPEDARVSAVRRAVARETSARPVAGPVAGPLRSALIAWRGDLAGIEQICAEADAAADAERLDADDIDECWAPFRDDLPAAVAAMIAENALSATRDGSSLDDRIGPEAIASFVSLWGHPIGA